MPEGLDARSRGSSAASSAIYLRGLSAAQSAIYLRGLSAAQSAAYRNPGNDEAPPRIQLDSGCTSGR